MCVFRLNSLFCKCESLKYLPSCFVVVKWMCVCVCVCVTDWRVREGSSRTPCLNSGREHFATRPPQDYALNSTWDRPGKLTSIHFCHIKNGPNIAFCELLQSILPFLHDEIIVSLCFSGSWHGTSVLFEMVPTPCHVLSPITSMLDASGQLLVYYL